MVILHAVARLAGVRMSKELSVTQAAQYVGPYRLEKTLGKGQTGKEMRFMRLTACYSLFSKPLSLINCLVNVCGVYRSGEARDSLHHWPKSSHQNSQQRKTLRICVDEGKDGKTSFNLSQLILKLAFK